MPPRRAPARRAAPPAAAPKPKRSALAREYEISAELEAEIDEAFSLFAVQHPDFEDEEKGVISRQDVRRCFTALEAPIPARDLAEVFETIDPDNTGYAPYEYFFGYAAIHLKQKREAKQESNDEEEDEDEPPVTKRKPKGKGKGKARAVSEDSEDQRAQVEEAFTLFTRGTGGGVITIAHLRRIAKDLKQEIDDQQLKDMILEANGGIKANGGAGDWRRGVTIEDFETVMKRAGVFG